MVEKRRADDGIQPAEDQEAHQKAWYERFVRGGIKRGHFWIWWENRKIRNNDNFVEVKDYVEPDGKVGFDIRSDDIELKWHWKAVRNPIKFHEESLEEWLFNNHGRVIGGDRIICHQLVGDHEAHQKAWHERFVKGGIKRGHFWIWWENRQIRNGKNFVEVKDYVEPDGKVGFDIRSDDIELKWHWKAVRNPIKFHEESLEEWLIRKVIHHGEKMMEEVG